MDLILEEGLQVNLVVFPEGQDPDSYVRKIGSEAFIEYIKKESKDIISFQANLFLQEAGDDPFKRSELIKEMVLSISKIPDAIQRSLFIQKTSSLMRLEEDVLLAEMNKIHLKNLKQRSGTQTQGGFAPISGQEFREVQHLIEPVAETSGESYQNLAFYQESECIRLLVNFGHLEINPDKAPGVSVTQYLLEELDGVLFQMPLFNKLMEICKNEFKNSNSLKPEFYLHHTDEEIQRFAIDCSSEKHNLSTTWKDRHEIKVTNEAEMLEDLAYKNVLRLRKVYNDQRLQESLELMANFQGDPNDMNDLLLNFIKLKEVQKNISQELGTVIEK
jgi:DNA primase